MRTGVLAHSEHTRRLHTAASRISSMPKCAACQFGKQVRRSPPGSTSTKVKDEADVLRAGNLLPGQKVSDVFTKTHWPQKRFHDLHLFQSPVYVQAN